MHIERHRRWVTQRGYIGRDWIHPDRDDRSAAGRSNTALSDNVVGGSIDVCRLRLFSRREGGERVKYPAVVSKLGTNTRELEFSFARSGQINLERKVIIGKILAGGEIQLILLF